MAKTSKGRKQVAAAKGKKKSAAKPSQTTAKENNPSPVKGDTPSVNTSEEMEVEEPKTPELQPEEPPKASPERKGSSATLSSTSTGRVTRRKSSSGAFAALQEAPGADYLREDMGHVELVRRLRRLHEYLMNVGQDEGVGQLGEIAAALASPAYVGHRDKDVRLLCACCLVDIIRIYAPDAPYESDQLVSIFGLFLEQIKGVGDAGGANFGLHYYLLERLSLVKAFVVVLDISNELVDDLFAQAFAQVNGGELPQNCIALYADVLQTCIAESDRLPAGALESLLLPLTYPNKKDCPRACAFAKLLVKACWERVRDELTSLYRDEGGAREDSELRGKVHELIFELNKVEPRVLAGVLPLLEGELRVDSDELRTLAVQLLSRMFAARGSELHTEYPQLFAAFLGRFGDKLAGIRCVMLEFAKYFMLRNAAPRAEADRGAPAALAERIGLGRELLLRLRDLDESVRLQAVATACDIAREFPELIEQAVLDEALERLKDRKPEVRAETMGRMAGLYTFMTYRAHIANESLSTSEIEALASGKNGSESNDDKSKLAKKKGSKAKSESGDDSGSDDNESEEDKEMEDGENEADDDDDEDRFVGMRKWWGNYAGIPSRILCCYMLGIEEDKLRVDSTFTDLIWRTAALTPAQRAFVEKLGGSTKSSQQPQRQRGKGSSNNSKKKKEEKEEKEKEAQILAALARAFVRILRGLDSRARTAFGLLVREKRALQQDFAAFVEAGAKGTKTPGLTRLTERLAVQCAPGTSADRAREATRRLLETRDGKTACEALRAVCNAESPLAAYAAHKHLCEQETNSDSSTQVNVVRGLGVRLCAALVANSAIARVIVDDLSESKHDADAFFEVLCGYSRLCPTEMSAFVDEVFDLLDVKQFRGNAGVTDAVLAVLATDATKGLGAKQPRVANAIRQRLMEYAQTGTPHQAKLAVRVMARMSSAADSAALAREFDPLLRLLTESATGADSPYRSTALQSLARIAQLVRNAGLIDKTVSPAFVYVTDTLLTQHPVTAADEEDADDRRQRVQAQEYGIKFLTYYLLTLRDFHVTKAAPIISLFFTLAASSSGEQVHTTKEGSDDEGDDSSNAESEKKGVVIEPEVRKAAACALINLARIKSYERLITPELLQKVAEFALDNDPAVRIGFERKLAKYLIAVQLPLRYLAALAFFACEPRRDLFSAVRLHIQQSVSARREYVKRMQATMSITNNNNGNGSNTTPSGNAQKQQQQQQQQQVLFLLLPEYSLPYLVSLLAHTERFDWDNFAFPARALWLLLGALMHGSSDYVFLEQIVHFIGFTEDARSPSMSENIYTASKIALGMIRKSAESHAWKDKGAHPGDVFLPPGFFKPVNDKARLRDLAKKMNDASLPSGLVLPDIINESFSRGSIAPPLSSTSTSMSTSMSTSTMSAATAASGPNSSVTSTPSKRKRRAPASPTHQKAPRLSIAAAADNNNNKGGNSKKSKKKSRRKSRYDDDDDDDDDSEDDEGSSNNNISESDNDNDSAATTKKKISAPETPTRVLPKRSAKRVVSYTEKD